MSRPPRIERFDGVLRLTAYWLVIGLALLVPLFDRQPVNLMAALLAIVVVVRLPLAGRRGLGHWDAIDWTMAAMLVSAALSTAFGWPSISGRMQGVSEALGYFTLFVAIRHGGHDGKQITRIGMAIVAGTIAASLLAIGLHLAKGSLVELPGVAGTIRSSLYAGITLMLSAGFAQQANGYRRWPWVAATLFLLTVLLSMTSRGVILAVLLCMLIGLVVCLRRRALRYLLAIAALGLLALALMPEKMQGQLHAKTTELVELVVHGKVSENDQVRVEIWRVALAWMSRGEHVLFGIGPRNYHQIDPDQLAVSPPPRFAETRHISHAHNLFLTRYVEQGLLGLLTLLALFVLIGKRLVRDAVAGRTGWAWWGALGGLLLPLFSGLFNSPWNRDYAWLAVLSFAIYLAAADKLANPAPRA